VIWWRFGEILNPLFMKLLTTNPADRIALVAAHPGLQPILHEDLLDLQMSIMSDVEFNEHVRLCNDFLHLNGIKIADLTFMTIPFDAFEDLFNEVADKRINGVRYVTALQVFFGCKDGGFFPVFQPIYMHWEKYDPVTQKELYVVPTDGFGNYYYFEGMQFHRINGEPELSLQKEWRNNYQNDISIIHHEGELHTNFIPDIDIESCIFPFQVIYKVLQELNSDNAYLTHAIRKVSFDSTHPIKHSVIFSGEEYQGLVDEAKYANRSHLCPPCNGISIGYDVV
jgi:hypothetical protein